MEESRQREEVGGLEEGIGKQKLCFDTVKLTPLRPFLPFSKNLVLDEDSTPKMDECFVRAMAVAYHRLQQSWTDGSCLQ